VLLSDEPYQGRAQVRRERKPNPARSDGPYHRYDDVPPPILVRQSVVLVVGFAQLGRVELERVEFRAIVVRWRFLGRVEVGERKQCENGRVRIDRREDRWEQLVMIPIDGMVQLMLVVRPFRAEAVLRVCSELGVTAGLVREAKGYGRQKGYLDRYRGSEYSMAYLPKVEITVWVPAARYEEVAAAVAKAARTGRIGDGKVFAVPTAWPHVVEF